MTGHTSSRIPTVGLILLGTTLFLAGCEEGAGLNLFNGGGARDTESSAEISNAPTRIVERDVEAPDVFQETDRGLWDGRPSLGGVWVAHPDVSDPERVIIRNEADGKFVIGALFRRERVNPGPRFQVSSDAAAALGLLAGQPANLNVVALRREEIVEEPAAGADGLPQEESISEAALDPIAAAAAAIDGDGDATQAASATGNAASTAAAPAATTATGATGAAATTAAAATTQAPARTPARAPTGGGLDKPFIQIGIFSVEENAQGTATSMRLAGMVPTVHEHTSGERRFWRVVVGPATSSSERAALLRKIKELGFEDAYFVSR